MKKIENAKNQSIDLEIQVEQLRDRLDSLNIKYFRTLEHWDAKHALLASKVRDAINIPYEKVKGQKRIDQLTAQKQQFTKLIEQVENLFGIKQEDQVSL